MEVKAGGKMEKEFILVEYIKEFLNSKERQWMIDGERYYKYENDILKTKKKSKLIHGFITNLVDEKISYLLSKDFTINCENTEYLNKLNECLSKNIQYEIDTIGIEASNKGIAWMHIYINEKSEFKYITIPSEQCCPIWKDNSKEELEGMLRIYDIEVYENRNKKEIRKVEYYTETDVTYYIYEQERLILDSEKYLKLEDKENYKHYKRGEQWKSWGRVPYVHFKNNKFEIPDIKSVKTLIDDYDNRRSDISQIIEKCKNFTYVLRGYSGTDKEKFWNDIEERLIKIDDPEGGIDALTPIIDNEAAKQHFEQLKKDIQHFGQGVNKDADAMGNSPSGIALKFLYSGLDLKCNKLEVEFQRGFQELIYFVNIYLQETGRGTYKEEVEIIFNRDIAVNESDTIEQCQKSTGVISQKTIISNHPWVKDVEKELKQLKKEEEQKEEINGNDEYGQLNKEREKNPEKDKINE